MTRTRLITAFFIGLPNSDLDLTCHDVFEAHDGEFVNCGTLVETRERDVEFHVPIDRARACVRELRARGFRVVVGQAALERYYVEQFSRPKPPPDPPPKTDTS